MKPAVAVMAKVPGAVPVKSRLHDALSADRAAAHLVGVRVSLLPAWFDVDTESDLGRLHTQMRAGAGAPARTFAFVDALYR